MSNLAGWWWTQAKPFQDDGEIGAKLFSLSGLILHSYRRNYLTQSECGNLESFPGWLGNHSQQDEGYVFVYMRERYETDQIKFCTIAQDSGFFNFRNRGCSQR